MKGVKGMIRRNIALTAIIFLLSFHSVSHADDFLRAKLWGAAVDSFVPDSGFITSFKVYQSADWNVLYAFNEFGDSGAIFQTRLWGTGVQDFLPADYIDSLKCLQNGDSVFLVAHSLDNTEGKVALSRIAGLGFQTTGAAPGSAINAILKTGPDSDGYCYLGISIAPVGINHGEKPPPTLPQRLDLTVFPNPFFDFCAITYTMPQTAQAILTIYDCSGRIVARLVSAKKSRGAHTIYWDGAASAPGIYFVKMKVGESRKMQKILLIK